MRKFLIFALLALSCLGWRQLPAGPSGVTKSQLKQTAPDPLHETIGTKIRRHALNAHTKNPFYKPYVCMAPTYMWSEVLKAGMKRVNGGNVYVVCAAATSAASGGGPTGKAFGGVVIENTSLYWEYVYDNTVTSDPNTTILTWVAAGTETAGQIYVVGGLTPGNKMYGVVGSGTAAGSAPTATTNNITDNTATLTFYGYYNPSPYGQMAPTATVSTSQPGSYLWYSASAPASSTAASGVLACVNTGSGYAAGDTWTSTGGTGTAVIVKIDTVSAGAVATFHLQSGGSFTLFPQSTVSQGSTSGSGTGAQFVLTFPDPYWLHVNGGYITGGTGGNNNVAGVAVMSKGVGIATSSRHISAQFQTMEPNPVFSWSSNPSNTQILYDDGSGWTPYNQDYLPWISGSTNYLTLSFKGGWRLRKFKFETAFDNTGASLPYIGLTSGCAPFTVIDKDTLTASVISDSLWDGNPVSPFSCGTYQANFLGYLLDWNIWDFAIGGTGYNNPGSYNTFGSRIAAALAVNPDILIFAGSTNDINYPNSGAVQATTTTNVQADLALARSSGFTGPIIVMGVESVSAAALTQEGYVSAAVSGWVDPLNSTYFVPFSNAAIPAIIGTYNNNPTPGGLTLSSLNNFTKLINGSDNVHPTELGFQTEDFYAVLYLRQFVFPIIP